MPGHRSVCQPHAQLIQSKLDQGLSAQRIFQDLRSEQGFTGSYHSVLRFVRRLQPRQNLPFRRMEVDPGDEVQVDFGQGAWIVDGQGKKRRPHLFRMVLSHSRKAYSEVVQQQTTDAFLQCLENAFRHFGGVTKTVVIDNLKAGVLQADWYDPELNPKLEAFARHYGTVILPTKPRTPRHAATTTSVPPWRTWRDRTPHRHSPTRRMPRHDRSAGTGAVVSIDLADDGTTTGEIFVAEGAEDGADLDEDLAGTWTLAGSIVTFEQGADTFIRDVEFTADEVVLIGEDTFDDVTIRLVLSKTDQCEALMSSPRDGTPSAQDQRQQKRGDGDGDVLGEAGCQSGIRWGREAAGTAHGVYSSSR